MSKPPLSDRDAAALAAGLLAVGVMLAGPLSGDTLFLADISYIYHPLMRWGADRLSTGELPVWNPDVGLGLPQLANPILGTLYPPAWVLAFLPFTTGINLLLAAHVALALVTTWRLLRALGAPGWPAVLGGAAFALGGAMLSSLMYGYPVLAWAWPALAAEGAVRLGRGEAWRRPVALIALGTGFALLAGDLMACVVAATMALLLAGPASDGSGRRRRTLVALGGVALGLALAAAQIGPTLALLPHSIRSAGDAGAAGTWSFAPARLLGFFQPQYWGRQWPQMSYWGWYLSETSLNDGNFFYPSISIGVVPLLLAPLAIGAPRTRRVAIALLVASVVALLLAFGTHLPVHGWLVEHVPGWGLVRYPEKWVLPATLGLALLGGLGLSVLGRAPLAAAVTAGVLAGLALCGSIAVVAADEALRATIEARSPVPNVDAARAAQLLGAALSGVAALAVLAGLVLRRMRPVAQAALALVGLMEVGVGNWGLAPTAAADLYDAPARTLALLGGGSEHAPVTRIERDDGLNRVSLHRDEHGLIERYRGQIATLRANAVLEAGRKRVGAESPARLAHAVQPEDWLWADPARAAPILGAELLLVAGGRLPDAVRRAATGLAPRGTVPGLGLLALAPVRPVLPDVFCVASVAPTPTAGVRLRLLRLDPNRSAVVEPSYTSGPDADLDALAAAAPVDAWPCARWSGDAGSFIIDVTVDRPALLVVRDAWAPGWGATEGGNALPVIRTYGSLKGIPIEPGAHQIELSYAAPGLLPGVAVSGLGALALIWFWWRKQGRAPLRDQKRS